LNGACAGGWAWAWDIRRRLLSEEQPPFSSHCLGRDRESVWSILTLFCTGYESFSRFLGIVLGCGEAAEKLPDLYPEPAVALLGVNGVMGEAGAFIRRPPHRLQVDEPVGL
jgi:hypothetical protein